MLLVAPLVSGAQSPPVPTTAVAGNTPSASSATSDHVALDDSAESYAAQHQAVQLHPEANPPAAAAPQAVVTPAALLELPSGPLGIPGAVLVAYHSAADQLATTMPGCHLPWSLLAGIGRIESGHADGGRVDAHGTTLGPILGPVLDGTNPGDGIVLTTAGGSPTFDRAEGPMQFLPSTWALYGADGNHDGVADINNVFDAALGAGRYLCSGGLDVADPAQVRTAVYRYNHSDAYVTNVLTWAAAYAAGVQPTASAPGPIPTTPPVTTPAAAKATPAPTTGTPAPAPPSAPSTPTEPTATSTPATTAPASTAPTTTPPPSETPAPSSTTPPPPGSSSPPVISLP